MERVCAGQGGAGEATLWPWQGGSAPGPGSQRPRVCFCLRAATLSCCLQVSHCLFLFSAKQLGISFWQGWWECLFLACIHRLALTSLCISKFYRSRKRDW